VLANVCWYLKLYLIKEIDDLGHCRFLNPAVLAAHEVVERLLRETHLPRESRFQYWRPSSSAVSDVDVYENPQGIHGVERAGAI